MKQALELAKLSLGGNQKIVEQTYKIWKRDGWREVERYLRNNDYDEEDIKDFATLVDFSKIKASRRLFLGQKIKSFLSVLGFLLLLIVVLLGSEQFAIGLNRILFVMAINFGWYNFAMNFAGSPVYTGAILFSILFYYFVYLIGKHKNK